MAVYEESIPDLIRGTIRDGLGIVRDEILLARTEMRQEVVRIKKTVQRSHAQAEYQQVAIDAGYYSLKYNKA